MSPKHFRSVRIIAYIFILKIFGALGVESPTEGPLENIAWNGRDTKGPPAGGWFVIRDRTKLPDPIRIVDPSQKDVKINTNKNEAQKAMNNVDPNRAKGTIDTELEVLQEPLEYKPT